MSLSVFSNEQLLLLHYLNCIFPLNTNLTSLFLYKIVSLIHTKFDSPFIIQHSLFLSNPLHSNSAYILPSYPYHSNSHFESIILQFHHHNFKLNLCPQTSHLRILLDHLCKILVHHIFVLIYHKHVVRNPLSVSIQPPELEIGQFLTYFYPNTLFFIYD